MKITILCSDPGHPINAYIETWAFQVSQNHQVVIARSKSALHGGDILFLISCSEIIRLPERQKYKATLVLHASDLPRGRGWSPHIWEIINGSEHVTISLLEAADQVDSGRIWKKLTVAVPNHCLWNEINERIFSAEIELLDFAIRELTHVQPQEQNSAIESTYYRRRTPADSRIDPGLSIAEQFDLIRACDPNRFPAFFDLRGHRYKLTLEKQDE